MNNNITKITAVGVLGWFCMLSSHAETWSLSAQTKVGFDIKSMGISVVKGRFKQVQSKMDFNIKQPNKAVAQFVMRVDSLDINKSSLKEKIMGEDFFYAAKYKTVTFKSTQFKSLGQDKYNIQGLLTLRGVTKPVLFHTTLKPDPSSSKILDVFASTIIERSDFGMQPAAAGIGERVNIHISGQWILK